MDSDWVEVGKGVFINLDQVAEVIVDGEGMAVAVRVWYSSGRTMTYRGDYAVGLVEFLRRRAESE